MHIDQIWLFIGKNKRNAVKLYPSAISVPPIYPPPITYWLRNYCILLYADKMAFNYADFEKFEQIAGYSHSWLTVRGWEKRTGALITMVLLITMLLQQIF